VGETVHKSFKFKLKPTPQQEAALEEVLWTCHVLYNGALEQRKTWWGRGQGNSPSRLEQEAEFKHLRAAFPEYAAIHSHVLHDVLAWLDKAFQAFFQRAQRGEKAGYPRFQPSTRYHSLTYKEHGNGARLDNGFLILSMIGRIAVRWSRSLQGTPKTVTISKEADGWNACLACAEVPVQRLPSTYKETGIDVGLKIFLVMAGGEVVDNPHHYRKAERDLKKAHRQVSRRKKGSKRHKKAVKLLAKKHQKVQRQRRAFHHETALALVRQYDTIYLEDVPVADMVRNRHLGKSISDAGWAAFRATLAYTAACAGTQVIAVPPAYTSQECSGCGARIQKTLSVRMHRCASCGLVLDRDENAAINILRAGRAGRGAAANAGVLKRESIGL
jgi:putative transposase